MATTRKTTRKAPAKGKTKVTGRQAILQVLADGKPRATKEITAAAAAIATDMKGKTPEATLGAFLYTQAKKPDGAVVRAGKGKFKLRPVKPGAAPKGDITTAAGRRARSEARQAEAELLDAGKAELEQEEVS
jgi:hypothetical protein